MYNLKSSSLYSRFYSWIWNTDVTKFKTMCPYFWRYVLTILFLPLILLLKPIISLIPKNYKDIIIKITKTKEIDNINQIMNSICVIVIFLVFLLIIIKIIITILDNYKRGFLLLLIILFVTASVLFLRKSILYLKPIIISLYKKICPLIKWN